MKNPVNVQAQHHHQSATTHLGQPKEHADHHHVKTMEMDWASHAKRSTTLPYTGQLTADARDEAKRTPGAKVGERPSSRV